MEYPESFWEFLKNLFSANDFMPHGHCYLWRPEIIGLHAGSDILIALSYYSIPLALIYFVRRRTDVAFSWLFVMFGVFIMACGTTHLMNVVTLWDPIYRFDGVLKACTALVSLATAAALWKIMPQALALPSPAQLSRANENLQHEIDQHTHTEELLRAREQRFSLLIDGVKDYAFCMLDPQGRIESWNTGAQRLAGYQEKDIIGKQFNCFYTPEDAAAGAPEKALQVALTEGRLEKECWQIRQDGSRFWASVIITAVRDQNGALRGFSSVTRDITSRRQAEETLAKHQALLQALIDHLPDYIFVKDTQSRLLLSNPAHLHMLGAANQADALGRSDVDFFPTDLAAEYYADEQSVLRTAQPLINKEELCLTSQGEARWLSTTKVPLRDSQGQVTGIIGMSRDITVNKQAEQQLRATAAALEKSNAELQQFANVASHDLQEPLRTVAGYLQLLERNETASLNDESKQFIQRSVAGVQRMQLLIHDLLLFSRVETRHRLATIDCGSALDHALVNLEAAIAESGAVIARTALPTLTADGTQLTQVFQNLIGNAIKFHGAQPPHIHVSAERHGAFWRFSVRDNGIGIDPQHAGRIFLIFQRLHSRSEYPGTGIGLAICKKIIENHGGQIGVDSVPGAGATFWFTIPHAGVHHA